VKVKLKYNLFAKSLKIPKGVIRSHKSKRGRQHNGQKNGEKNKQRSTKHYTEN